jgi:hypothetical protein
MVTSIKLELLLLIGAALAVPASAQEVQRPVWNPQDTWSFSTIVEGASWNASPRMNSTSRFTVLNSNARNYSVRVDTATQDLGEGHQDSREMKITMALNTYSRRLPQFPNGIEAEYLRWPLVVGKTWTFETPTSDDQAALATVRVTGWEDIKVAAGQFHAIVVSVEASQKGGGFYFQRMTLWYAPEAKWVVKKQWATSVGKANVSQTGVSELQSFSLN